MALPASRRMIDLHYAHVTHDAHLEGGGRPLAIAVLGGRVALSRHMQQLHIGSRLRRGSSSVVSTPWTFAPTTSSLST